MSISGYAFLATDAQAEAGWATDSPYLRIRPDGDSAGDVTLFLGSTFAGDRLELARRQVAAIRAALDTIETRIAQAELAETGAGPELVSGGRLTLEGAARLLESAGPDDDEDEDEPSEADATTAALASTVAYQVEYHPTGMGHGPNGWAVYSVYHGEDIVTGLTLEAACREVSDLTAQELAATAAEGWDLARALEDQRRQATATAQAVTRPAPAAWAGTPAAVQPAYQLAPASEAELRALAGDR